MTENKRTLTDAQYAALKEYHAAYRLEDFNRLLFAIVGLSDVGLCEADATELIARGYGLPPYTQDATQGTQ